MHPKVTAPNSVLPINIVGGNTFGRSNKISSEKTYNMMISDGWLVQLPGYRKSLTLKTSGIGRANYSSERGNFMIAVVDDVVYRITGSKTNLARQPIFNLNSFFGTIYIAENIASQIAVCDGSDLWIYNFRTGEVTLADLPINTDTGNPILPGYVTYHDGYFIVPDITSNRWYLSAPNDGTSWNWGAGGVPVFAAIQTKPDDAVAVLRAPGRGNLIYVFGRNVTEFWYDNGGQLFPYQRSNASSVDYGCLSASTIAAMDNYIAWLGVNEKSGPVIMVSSGTNFTRLSNDGIDYQLARIKEPQRSVGMFYKQDGHVFYQLTFYGRNDNFSLVYDFNSETFVYSTDEDLNYHPARSVAFYDSTYFFTSIRDSHLYELSSEYTTYDYSTPLSTGYVAEPSKIFEIPRVRYCRPIRKEDASNFIANLVTLTMEMGNDQDYKGTKLRYIATESGKVITTERQEGFVGRIITSEREVNPYVPRVDMAVSKDGGESFSNFISAPMNPQGKRKNTVNFWKLGRANDLVLQFRFWSKSNVTVTDALLQVKAVSER